MTARTGKAILAGVIGDPIAQSLSPALHEYWLAQHQIDGAYVPLHVTPSNLRSTLNLLAKLGFSGFNATLPHKEEMYHLVDGMDETGRMIGALNTFHFKANGTIFGTNTDAYGFIQNLITTLNEKNHTFDFSQAHILVLGAGGAARAIIVGLVQQGCKHITLCNRNAQRMQTLRDTLMGFPAFKEVSIICAPWEERQAATSQAIDLLVNTTQLGMVGQPELDITLENLPKHCIVSDIVYNPLITPLLADAQQHGLTIVDGLGMLLWQAQRGFELWFGVKPEITPPLRHHVLACKS